MNALRRIALTVIVALCLVLLAMFSPVSHGQETEQVPDWYDGPINEDAVVSSGSTNMVVFRHEPYQSRLYPGDLFTQIVTVTAPVTGTVALVQFGFTNPNTSLAEYVNSNATVGTCNYVEAVPHFECRVDLAANQTAVFTFVSRAREEGSVHTFAVAEVWQLNSLFPPSLSNYGVEWNVLDPTVQVIMGSKWEKRGNIVRIPLDFLNMRGNVLSFGGTISGIDEHVIEFDHAELGPAAAHFTAFRALRDPQTGEIVFYGYHNTEPIAADNGTVATFWFKVVGDNLTNSPLNLVNVEVGDGEPISVTNGWVNVEETYIIEGVVRSVFDSTPDDMVHFNYQHPGGSELRSVYRGTGKFLIEHAVPGDHSLTFFTWRSDEARHIEITDLTIGELCYLRALLPENCKLMTLDSFPDGQHTPRDVRMQASFIMGVPEEGSIVGVHRFEPNPLHVLGIRSNQRNLVVESGLVGDTNGSVFSDPSVQTASAPTVKVVQNGPTATITVEAGHAFHGALITLEGATVTSATSGNRTVRFDENQIVLYGRNAYQDMVIDATVAGTITASSAKVSDPIDVPNEPEPAPENKIFLPAVSR